jgi:hypothetical protein
MKDGDYFLIGGLFGVCICLIIGIWVRDLTMPLIYCFLAGVVYYIYRGIKLWLENKFKIF